MRYTIKQPLFESGERLPMLVDRQIGSPMFDPTVFTLTEFRTRDRASATIEQVLRGLMVFYLFCDAHQIDLLENMQDGRLLELGEVDALARLCRLPMKEVERQVEVRSSKQIWTMTSSLESYRGSSKASKAIPYVSGDSAAIRIRYIAQYIGWLADRRIQHLGASHPMRAPLLLAKDATVRGLAARIPTDKTRSKKRSSAQKRMALDEAAQDRLWQVIDMNSRENPWEGRHARARNDLIVRWFMGLGIRRGELLGVRVTDVDFRTNQVFIARRADDPDDPRRHEPNTKTQARLLPISDDLARRTRQYVLEERRRYPQARRHAFLFVANGGAPLSLRGLNKIFSTLSNQCPELPKIFPHLFRHTYNYNFSKIADQRGMNPEWEKKTRSQVMGWSETSGSAESYTYREIEQEAREASLQLQKKMGKPHYGDAQ